MNTKFYFDDEEEGLSPQTSHPKFNEIISDYFYFDCMDEFSPFGNDEGAEILYALQDWYKEKKGKGNVLKWLYNRIDGYGFEYESEWASKILDIEELNSILEEDEFLLLCMDEAIIATAFGQYKIEGKIDKSLKLVALTAMERQKILNQQTLLSGEIDISKLIQVVDGESTRPDENGQTTHLTNKYIERLEIMKSDLVKFEEK